MPRRPRKPDLSRFAAPALWLGLVVTALAPSLVAGTLENTESLRAVGYWEALQPHPVDLQGVVIYSDPAQQRLVIQDQRGAVSLRGKGLDRPFRIGQRVRIQAKDSKPLLIALPDYPFHPTLRREVGAFETPANEGNYFIDQVSGVLYPPKSGFYRFWVAADDTAELYLSEGPKYVAAERIAACYTWAKPGDWSASPEQGSPPIFLEAGKKYLLRAIHEQFGGNSNLAVAWEGPDLPRQVIHGVYLSPWTTAQQSDAAAEPPAGPTGTASWETWSNRTTDGVWKLTVGRWFYGNLHVLDPQVTTEGEAPLPAPQVLELGKFLGPDEAFRWSRVEGTVTFVSRDDAGLVVELSDSGKRLQVLVPGWTGETPQRWRDRRVTAEGIAQPGLSSPNDLTLATLVASDPSRIRILDTNAFEGKARHLALHEIARAGKELPADEAVRVTGEIVARPDSGTLILRDFGSFTGSFSTDGITWYPIGAPVEVPMRGKIEAGVAVNSDSSTDKASTSFEILRAPSNQFTQTDVGFEKPLSTEVAGKTGVKVEAAGRQIWNTPDQFYFHHTSFEGEGEIVARIDFLKSGNESAKAGVMIRDSLDGEAQFIDLVVTRDFNLSLQWRQHLQGHGPKAVYGPRLSNPCWLRLKREYSYLTVNYTGNTAFGLGQTVEVEGFPLHGRDGVSLTEASCRPAPAPALAPAQDPSPRKLLSIAELLTPSRETQALDILMIRGLVTYSGDIGGKKVIVVQDATGAVLALPGKDSPPTPFAVGDWVEVHSNPGWRLPKTADFVADRILVLGRGTEPVPVRHPLQYLLPRRGEGAWTEIQGVVRQARDEKTIELKDRGEVFEVSIPDLGKGEAERLVDSLVRIRGVITYPGENGRRLMVPGKRNLEVEQRSPADPFGIPLQRIAALGGTQLLNAASRAVRVQGTVILAEEKSCILQDESGVLKVDFDSPELHVPGEMIEAVGFPDALGEGHLVLTHTRTRPTSGLDLPEPIELPPEETHSGPALFKLVHLKGEIAPSPVGNAPLSLATPAGPLPLVLPDNKALDEDLPSGTLVEATGVLMPRPVPAPREVNADASARVQLVLRSGADLLVLHKPRWWVVQRTLLFTSLAVFIAVVGMLWIQVLRRRVAQRTRELQATLEKLRQETQTAATLSERNRLAGEIHDSLEQGFSALLLQLDATAKLPSCPPDVRSSLSLAQSMVSFSRAEVQHAVWDLQSPLLEENDLPSAIRKIFEQVAPLHLSTDVKVSGAPRRLPPATEHHMLRVTQEAITNAVKHAEPTEISVEVDYQADKVVITVRDNGKGFDPSAVLTGGLGHFGLRSLRGRAKKVSGQIRIESQPGSGTTISLTVPTHVV